MDIIIQQKLAELRDAEKNAQAQLYLWQKTLDEIDNHINALKGVVAEKANQDKISKTKTASLVALKKSQEAEKVKNKRNTK